MESFRGGLHRGGLDVVDVVVIASNPPFTASMPDKSYVPTVSHGVVFTEPVPLHSLILAQVSGFSLPEMADLLIPDPNISLPTQ